MSLCGTTTDEQVKIELLRQWKLEAEFRKLGVPNWATYGMHNCRQPPSETKRNNSTVLSVLPSNVISSFNAMAMVFSPQATILFKSYWDTWFLRCVN